MTTEPRSVRIFVIATVAAALSLFGGLAVARPDGISAPVWTLALLVAAGVAAERQPLHLTAKTKIFVDTSIFVAMALVLDPLTATATVAATMAINELLRHESWTQGLFNIAQSALYVGCGSLTYWWLAGFETGATLPRLGNMVAVLAALAVMHGLNTALVSVVAALQLGHDPLRTWLDGLAIDLPEHLALAANGVLLAVILDGYPWLLPLAAAPLGLVYLSLRQSSALRAAMRASIEAAADLGDLLDREPAGHSVRVARRSHQLAERLGMGPRDTAHVADAARVHHARRFDRRPIDAGNGLPIAIPGAPAEIPEPVAALSVYAHGIAMLRYVPERWDDAGEATEHAATSIPIGARVIAVADAYDRLTAPQGDRPGLDPESALAVLRTSARSEWDPRVVAMMADIVHHEVGSDGAAALS